MCNRPHGRGLRLTADIVSVRRQSKQSNWIQKAIKRPGAFRAKAKRAGKSTKAFAQQVLRNPKRYDSRTVRQARLAITLMRLRRRSSR